MDATEALVAAARQRDRRAIEDLLVQHLSTLEAFVRLRMGPALRAKLTAPDVVQSVCREVLEDLGEFDYVVQLRTIAATAPTVDNETIFDPFATFIHSPFLLRRLQ